MSRGRRTRSEGGSTLAEVLVAMAILIIAGVSIVSGMASASVASDTHRKEVTADAVVRSFAEVITQRAQLGFYVPCATALPPLGGWAPPTGYTATLDPSQANPIEYWHTATTSFTTACPPDEGAQLLFLVAKSLDGRDSEALQVIVRTP